MRCVLNWPDRAILDVVEEYGERTVKEFVDAVARRWPGDPRVTRWQEEVDEYLRRRAK